jgi:hypothetical protein
MVPDSHGVPTDAAAAFMMRPTTMPSAPRHNRVDIGDGLYLLGMFFRLGFFTTASSMKATCIHIRF